MFKKNVFTKIMNNKDKIVTLVCFWGVLCFNIMMIYMTIYELFTYDGGMNDPKSYYEIKTLENAHNEFMQHTFLSWLCGLLFTFPLIWSCLFIKRITLNAVLLQLLPILAVSGMILFSEQ